jgi:hypothetical protein
MVDGWTKIPILVYIDQIVDEFLKSHQGDYELYDEGSRVE